MKRLLGFLLILVALIAIAVGAALATAIVGMRSGNRRFIRAFTKFQRDVVNPEVLKTAGDAGQPFSVIEHVGRTSGTEYETPVGARRDGDGWVVSLVYGREASWVQNLLAAGSGFLRVDGRRHRVDGFEIVPIDTAPLPEDEAKAVAFFGISEALRLHDAGEVDAAAETATDNADDASS
ncbi:nitroreductase family deazaflavin-dependent oxidoreductase [Microbacter sp. GSS18]|nr:nitroreductase family deazaflavin-dependent oxidoreductase [Microbacter sp. GSS18]